MAEYIEREAAKTAAALIALTSVSREMRCGEVKRIMEEIPAADVREVVRGKWELDSDGLPVCSECGEIALQRIFVKVPHLIQEVRMVRSSYCPNCGASMED